MPSGRDHEEMDMNERGTAQDGVGISGSELAVSVMRQVRAVQASGNPRKALQAGLQHLEQRHLINREERGSLTRMCDFAMIAGAGGKGGAAAVERLRRLHDTMVVTRSGPIAVAIAGAIVQHSTSSGGGSTALKL